MISRFKKPMPVIITIVLLLIVAFTIVLFLISQGKPEPFRDEQNKIIPGSISEKVFLRIGGVRQGMFIKGKDVNNPVMLFVHGGPSFPEYFLVDKYPTGIEEHFTVCYWEERGGGISYSRDVTVGSMTFEQLGSDAIEVTNYLRQRFHKEKIYLMAHSGGTAFAIQVAADHPELYHAYIAMAQITNQPESEKLAYRYMLERYSEKNNRKALAELGKYPVLENDSLILPFFNSILRDKSMHELGIGTMHNMRSIFRDVFLPVWTCRAYTVKEKINIWVSKFSFINKTGLRSQLLNTNIPLKVPAINIPVYFISGKFDLTVNKDLSREYLKKLEAPARGFYTFENSAHSPMFEEPLKLKEILVKDILTGQTRLSDR